MTLNARFADLKPAGFAIGTAAGMWSLKTFRIRRLTLAVMA
jgi:hypothetical protein